MVDELYYTGPTSSNQEWFHADRGCSYLKAAPVERSESYIEYHDLSPCPYCAGGESPHG